ncbi:MAG: FadR/GntR family transcriptional regulator [Spirochaetota bacterium]
MAQDHRENNLGGAPARRPLHRRTMAQEMADTLTEEIVSGQRRPGDALPTEPELAEEFQVSRSVVRDATRILAARGLVDVQHGKGAFVTESQLEAFGDALLLALRRQSASVWDVEEFFQVVWPEVFALAAERATEEDIRSVRDATDEYLRLFAELTRRTHEEKRTATPGERERMLGGYAAFLNAVLAASHNKVLSLLSSPFQAVRSVREWEYPTDNPEMLIDAESAALYRAVEALESRDPDRARAVVAKLMELPPEAKRAMRETPVGEIAHIPASLTDFIRDQGLEE